MKNVSASLVGVEVRKERRSAHINSGMYPALDGLLLRSLQRDIARHPRRGMHGVLVTVGLGRRAL